MHDLICQRRAFLQNIGLGFISFNSIRLISNPPLQGVRHIGKDFHYRYPAIKDEYSYGVVSAAHSDLDKVKELVGKRPELANAAWDWGFGDYETAIGAASHMGRRDIAEYLMSQGARPDIFTFAMMGMLNTLKEIIETVPGIQQRRGPHGITLLKHAKNRLSVKDLAEKDKKSIQKVIKYLEKLGDADMGATSLPLADIDKTPLLGDYRFGNGETEILEVVASKMNANLIRMVRKGSIGSTLHKVGEHTFSPTGASSVKIVFEVQNGVANALSIIDFDGTIKANRV
ncbi:MAG: hypothetical protein ACKVU0_00745 [Saprospiraceae bacterium]